MTPAILRKHINLRYASHYLDDEPRVRDAVEALAGVTAHRQEAPLLTAIRGWLSWRDHGAEVVVKVREVTGLGGERNKAAAAALAADYYAELARRRALVVKVRDLTGLGGERNIAAAAALAADYYREAA